VRGSGPAGALVLPDGRRIPVVGSTSIGRAPGNTVQLTDPAVSRVHAIVRVGASATTIEDVGSRGGTYVDDRLVNGRVALRDGARVRLAGTTLTFEHRRGTGAPGRTTVVCAAPRPTSRLAGRPALVEGASIKRVPGPSGDRRWVVRHPRSGATVRMSEADAAVLGMLDGEHSMTELVAAAERRHGVAGPARLAQMLASLADKELLVAAAAPSRPRGRLGRLARPREHVVELVRIARVGLQRGRAALAHDIERLVVDAKRLGLHLGDVLSAIKKEWL
jgi:hypothetical protein